jgi:methionyl aminopeptidase
MQNSCQNLPWIFLKEPCLTIENEDQLLFLQKIGRIVADCLCYMLASIEDGMTTKELDDVGRKYLEDYGARSAPELTYKFPGATCISLEGEAAHGVPSASKVIRPETLINIDVSAELDGYFADTGASYLYKGSNERLKKLCKSTKRALNSAIREVRSGVPLNVIGKAVEKEARKSGFAIIRNLCSHGVGAALHEQPDGIKGYFDRNDKRVIREGSVFTIEPFLSTKTTEVYEADDGWTLVNWPGHFSAQYEHSMVATKKGAIILTLPTSGQPFQPASKPA